MPRLRQVPRSEAPPEVVEMYKLLFGDRDPVAEPGTTTGTPGDWWTVVALVPEPHLAGVAERLRAGAEAPNELEPLLIVPPKSLISKIVPWAFSALIVTAFILGFVFGDIEKLQDLAFANPCSRARH